MARLLAVGDDVESRMDLIADRDGDRILDELGDVVRTERSRRLCRADLKPPGEGVAPDDRRENRPRAASAKRTEASTADARLPNTTVRLRPPALAA